MALIYGGKKLIPASLINVEKEYQKTEDGTIIGSVFVLTLKNKIVSYKGSPTSSGTWWTTSGYPPDETITQDKRLASMLRKEEAIRQLFANEGQVLDVQPLDGSPSLKCNPRVRSIAFAEGTWTEVCEYTIVLEADVVYINGTALGEDALTPYISSANEDWQIEFGDVQETFRITHNVSAVGKRFYNDAGTLVKPAWKQAQDYVLPLLGIDATRLTASGVLNLPDYFGVVNHARTESVNELAGSYSVSETWIGCSGAAFEEYTIETHIDESNKVTANIQGTVTGLELRAFSPYGVTQSKITSAAGYFTTYVNGNMLNRIQTTTGLVFNPAPLTQVVTRNIIGGTIGYNYEYNNRPSNTIAGALSESIELTYINQGNVIAQVPVIGRTTGPVLQSLNANTALGLQLSIEVVVSGASYGSTPSKPNLNPLVTTYTPVAGQVYKVSDRETWNPSTGRASRQVEWTYE